MKKITINDQKTFEKILSKCSTIDKHYYGSDFLFSYIYTWFDAEYFIDEIALYIKLSENIFLPPLVLTDSTFDIAIERIKNNKIVGFTKEMIAKSSNTFTYNRNSSEYIYKSLDLIYLKGKKYKAKRNNINKFVANYKYVFRDYENSDFTQCLKLFDLWNQSHNVINERKALIKALKNMDELSLFCSVIEIESKIKAFAIGTIKNNIGYVFFEKGDTNYSGIFQAINNFFSAKYFKNVDLVNRQDDLGLEPLRKSKLSYNPYLLLEKYEKWP